MLLALPVWLLRVSPDPRVLLAFPVTMELMERSAQLDLLVLLAHLVRLCLRRAWE